MKYQILHGDNRETLKTIPDNSIDAIVTDPPYGIDFLGKAWDANTGALETYQECLRVLKPGGHIVAFSAARTYHHLAVTLEQAGFEIRDQIMWIYSSGFPKSQDVGKSIDRAEKKLDPNYGSIPRDKQASFVSTEGKGNKSSRCKKCLKDIVMQYSCKDTECAMVYNPQTDDGKKWHGWGTALKPALEPIIVGRKPLSEKNVSLNVLKWGTGGINIGASRIGNEERTDTITENGFGSNFMDDGWVPSGKTYEKTVTGRFPSNVIFQHSEGCAPTGETKTSKTSAGNRTATFGTQETVSGGDGSGGFEGYEYTVEIYNCVDGCPIKELDEQSGTSKSGKPRADRGTGGIWKEGDGVPVGPQYGDTGGASRFFHQTTPDAEPTGRFPANLIFTHGEDCVEIGVVEESYAINKTEEWTGFGQKERPDYESTEQKVSTVLYECVDGCPVKELDEQSGQSTSKVGNPRGTTKKGLFANSEFNKVGKEHNDSGGASRFFYVAKANKKDRNEGLDGLIEKGKVYNGTSEDSAGKAPGSVEDKFTTKPQTNFHPTVKPTSLMEYLVALVCPVGGVVLDPFTGSGSTGKAAIRKGMKFVGIEMTDEYLPIIKGRLEHEINKKNGSLF
jgi:site-specific DNA-methyltransferase (adenine-specific)